MSICIFSHVLARLNTFLRLTPQTQMLNRETFPAKLEVLEEPASDAIDDVLSTPQGLDRIKIAIS